MSRSLTASRRLPQQVGLFDALLLHWLVLGALALLLAPDWHHPWLGWLPYWLVLVPGVCVGWRWINADPRANGADAHVLVVDRRRPGLRRGSVAQACTLRTTAEYQPCHVFHPASHRPRSRPDPGRASFRRRLQHWPD